MPTHRDPAWETMLSLMKAQQAVMNMGLGFAFHIRFGNNSAGNARSEVTHHFLQSDCDRIFWIDSDMVFEPNDFLLLLALSQMHECVGAAYVMKREPYLSCAQTLDNEPVQPDEYGCFPMKGFGLGFCCVQRKVMEELSAKAQLRQYFNSDEPGKEYRLPKVFRSDDESGCDRTEDFCFFEDVRSLGYKTWLYPNITLGHVGRKVYRADITDFMQRIDQPDEEIRSDVAADVGSRKEKS